MSVFEYVVGIVSIVLGLALASTASYAVQEMLQSPVGQP